MPLGNARDFGHDPNPAVPGDDENAWTDAAPQYQGNIRRIEDEVENLGPEIDETFDDPFAGAEVGEYLDDPGQTIQGSPEELAELMSYLNMMQTQYPVTPTDLVVLKNEGVISIAEARAYLSVRGVIAGD